MRWQKPMIEHMIPTKWQWLVSYPDNLTLGKNVDIGAFTYINAKQGVILEDNVQIGAQCCIYSVSTIDGKQGQIHIKKNAKVGVNSMVAPGITIGENSLVGACSFVNKNIPDNEIWYGCPARFIRKL